jgi:hypothetical protein
VYRVVLNISNSIRLHCGNSPLSQNLAVVIMPIKLLQIIYTMLKKHLLFILSLTSHFSFSQQQYKVTYEQLKEFEGLYEYGNHTTLKIAASPRDTSL